MSETLRFPFNRDIPHVGRNESSQILTIASAVTSLPLGGAQSYADIRPWKISGEQTEAPYPCVVLEFSSNIPTTIGNGTTDLIGLYGQIDLVQNPASATDRKRQFLGVIGINIGNVMPQIPIVQQAGPANDVVGFSQMFNNIAVYDRLSIGGVLAAVTLGEGVQLTVVARPIRRREYLG